jgi:hypothetical protein
MEINKVRIILLLISGIFLLHGCEGKGYNEKAVIVQKNSTVSERKSKTLSNVDNVLPVGNTYPYKEVDSLMRLIKQNYSVVYVRRLEEICAKSDGDLSEYLDDIVNKLFNDHLNEFTDYLIDNPTSCLKGRLIEEISSQLSVYPKNERPKKLLEEQEEKLALGSKQNLSAEKLAFIKDMFKKVNPDILD